MTVYEFNKQVYSAKEPMENFDQAKKDICTYLISHENKHYMFLNNEKHYYTVFYVHDSNSLPNVADELVAIAKDLGPIYDIFANQNGAIELWIKYENEPRVFMFFPYDRGVIEV